uniref:tripeptidyl-peptidase II n=1 Tax=Mycena chlorophos TaxID=658473 RepID=A0ABQ0LWK6_MYCCL|nr:family S53 protease-like protein [Mycena chlorophos]
MGAANEWRFLERRAVPRRRVMSMLSAMRAVGRCRWRDGCRVDPLSGSCLRQHTLRLRSYSAAGIRLKLEDNARNAAIVECSSISRRVSAIFATVPVTLTPPGAPSGGAIQLAMKGRWYSGNLSFYALNFTLMHTFANLLPSSARSSRADLSLHTLTDFSRSLLKCIVLQQQAPTGSHRQQRPSDCRSYLPLAAHEARMPLRSRCGPAAVRSRFLALEAKGNRTERDGANAVAMRLLRRDRRETAWEGAEPCGEAIHFALPAASQPRVEKQSRSSWRPRAPLIITDGSFSQYDTNSTASFDSKNMALLRASFFAALVALALATPTDRSALVVHEHRAQPARGFVNLGAAPAETQLTLRLLLKPNNIAGLEGRLLSVSDPSSQSYGQHLSIDEVISYVKPTTDAVSAVNAWLSSNEISATPVSPAGDLLEFTVPVSKASSLFDADFSVFGLSGTNTTNIRTLQYSLPSDLTSYVQFVHPMTSFSTPFSKPKISALSAKSGKRDVSDIDASCADITTPSCVLNEYNIPTTLPAKQSNNVLGVSGFDNEFANFLDLQEFLTDYTDVSPSTSFSVQLLDGGSNTQLRSFAGEEASLDIDYTVGIVGPAVQVEFISVGPLNDDNLSGFLDEINFLINSTSRPTVLTTSYGFDEEDVTFPVYEGLCNAYMQLGALGTSLLFASGDGGVAGNDFECTTFVPTGPSSCPWVTSVGSSQAVLENFTKNNFTTIGAFFSSGGFSNYFPAPAYQQAAVSAYVKSLGDEYAGLYNTTGRGFPDVSAEGINFVVVAANTTGLVEGTSCSSPVFASVVALLNAELLAANKPVLGFLNPFLYSPAGQAALTDVIGGTNPGCNTNGFNATAGWDPVTGLGTPDYTKLRAALGLS